METEDERASRLETDWAGVEATLTRLCREPTEQTFYRRLHGEYRVAARYAENLLGGSLQRYARQLQLEGLRSMGFDAIAGAAEFVVGAWMESMASRRPGMVRERARALIDQAVARHGKGTDTQAVA